MSEEYKHLDGEEKLAAENAFMKLKIMAEHGGQFYSGDTDEELPAEIENQFLKNVIDFETQFDRCKMIRLFDKIGKPARFKPVDQINDDKIEQEYKSLLDHLAKYAE